MFNSMNYGRRKEDNPIFSLSFIWTAKFKDSEDICQFDFETGKENRFQEVINKIDKLEYFILWNKEKYFTVDLTNGLIYYNTKLKEEKYLHKEKHNIRLIYFRRHKVEMGLNNFKEIKHEIIYFLGFQYNTDDNQNRKILIQIDKNGSWLLGE